MPKCDICGRDNFRSRPALDWHLKLKHPTALGLPSDSPSPPQSNHSDELNRLSQRIEGNIIEVKKDLERQLADTRRGLAKAIKPLHKRVVAEQRKAKEPVVIEPAEPEPEPTPEPKPFPLSLIK